ncbi:MAG: hypothetical protein ACK55Z_28775 [bacterium]
MAPFNNIPCSCPMGGGRTITGFLALASDGVTPPIHCEDTLSRCVLHMVLL